jgi:hypothetical protein
MSILWAASAAFVFIAALCCRVLIVARYREVGYTPNWLAPVLFGLMLLVAGLVLLAAKQAG